MSGFVVRVATVDDAEVIARVHIEAWRQTYSELVEPGEFDELSLERRTERWRSKLQDDGDTWVAVSEGAVIGFAGARSHDDHAVRPRELEYIYVLADHHGTGIGQALLDQAIGDVPAFVFVACDNPRAIHFYERNRFEFDGASETYPLVRTPIVSLRMVR